MKGVEGYHRIQDPNDNSMLDMLIGYSCMQIRILLLLLLLLLLLSSRSIYVTKMVLRIRQHTYTDVLQTGIFSPLMNLSRFLIESNCFD